jgi:hypothetical protein
MLLKKQFEMLSSPPVPKKRKPPGGPVENIFVTTQKSIE